jgi:endonuclease-3
MHTPPEPAPVDDALALSYPDVACDLLARDPWELLMAAILSERAHELQVNKVMAVLSEHLTSIAAVAEIDHRDLEPALRQLPLYREKARALVEAARCILRLHHGQVPRTMEALAAIPGVSRPAAALVLGHAFATPAFAATPEVRRVLSRLGWVAGTHPAEAEHAISERFAPQYWVVLSQRLLRLGRDSCRRVSPRCERCPLLELCPRRGCTSAACDTEDQGAPDRH